MVIKKGIGDSLIYLTLIVTALRSVRYPIENLFQYNSSDNGPSTTTVNLFINFGHLYSESNYPNSKTDLLVLETLNVFRDINSLGRYSSQYSTNLFAYLVNGDETDQSATISSTSVLPLPEVDSSLSSSGCLTFPLTSSTPSSLSSSPSLSSSFSSSSPSSPLSEQKAAINSSLPNSKNETLTQSQSLSHSASPGVDSDFISEDEDLILSDFNETLLDEIEKFSAAYDDPLLSALAQDQNENEVDSLFDDLEKILNSDEEGLGPQENSESHFDIWNGNFNHIPLLQAPQIQQNSLDQNYHNYYTFSESIHYYGTNGLTNEINIDNEYSNTTLLSAAPVTIPVDGLVENNYNQFYSNSGSLNYFTSANISNEVVCEQEPSNDYVDSSISEINSNLWNNCSNVESLNNESSAAVGGYSTENYAVSDSVDSYSNNLSINQANGNTSLHNHTYHLQGSSSIKSRIELKNSISDQSDDDACISRDEKRAKALGIPISIQDIINLPIDEFNERLAKYELTEVQLSLIRDIRRRGKNKVAAQNCRRRKMDQIIDLQSEVERLYSQKKAFQIQHEQLIALRHIAREKYTKLYDFIVSSSASQSVANYPILSEYSRILVSPSIDSSTNGN